MKVFRGKVVGVKNKKTAIVEVARFFAHRLYLKRIRKTKRYPVHDERGVKEGDIVRFMETRPLSKTKRWKIVEVIKGEKVPNVSKAKKKENRRKSARKSAKNRRLATERRQR